MFYYVDPHLYKTKYATTSNTRAGLPGRISVGTILFSLLLWKRFTPELKLLLSRFISWPLFLFAFKPAFTASRPDCSRYYPLGIAPIVFSFDLLHISYLSLGNSCSQTFDEDSRIFCRSRPSWHSATWPLVWLQTFDYFILLCLLPTLWPR